MYGSRLKENCGIFGIYGHPKAAEITHLGLYALQHRGQESAGIVASGGKGFRIHRGLGLVADVFTPEVLGRLTGHLALGHVRYSTTGSPSPANMQPFAVNYAGGSVAVAHNGNLVNAATLRRKLEEEGSIFQTSMDSEIVVHLLARAGSGSFEESLRGALGALEGAYSLGLMSERRLVAARDPHGWRPLCIGVLDRAYVVASESCALDLIGAKYLREVKPGEVVFFDQEGIRSLEPSTEPQPAFCIFEYIYFARPDSSIFGHNVYLTRKRLGARLARAHPAEAELVIPVPDSGTFAALGFAEEAGLPFEMGFIRNHYVGRTFIQPSQLVRDFSVKVKLNPVAGLLEGKRVVVVEDSIVRGTTSRARMRSLRDVGAREVHMRVSCPPLRYPCFFGIDFPTPDELIANRKSVAEIREFLGLDSLAYLSLEDMLAAMPLPGDCFCTACFTGKYPVPVREKMDKLRLERTVSGCSTC